MIRFDLYGIDAGRRPRPTLADEVPLVDVDVLTATKLMTEYVVADFVGYCKPAAGLSVRFLYTDIRLCAVVNEQTGDGRPQVFKGHGKSEHLGDAVDVNWRLSSTATFGKGFRLLSHKMHSHLDSSGLGC